MGTRGYKRGHKEYMKDYFRRNPKKYLLASAKSRARLGGYECTITENDIEIPEFCPILAVKLSQVRQGQGTKDNVPSLDKLDNEKGYVPGNIRVISFRANRYKSNMTREQVISLYNYVISS